MKRIICLVLSLLLLLCGCGTVTPPEVTTIPEETEPPMSPYAQAAMDTNTLHYYFFTGDGQTANTISPYNYYTTTSGDACLIFFPNGETMLIDTSTTVIYPAFKAWLEEKGVYRIDHLVLTHDMDDHTGGANSGLIFDFKIGMIYHNGTRNELLFTALDNNIDFKEMNLGDELQIGSGDSLTTVKVMWPIEEFRKSANAGAGKQSQSLVLRIDFGEHSSLFAGDIYKTYKGGSDAREKKKEYWIQDQVGAEEQMAALYENGELDVDLLKLANHGNPNTSNGHALFDATTPELCVSSGFHPAYLGSYELRGFEGLTLFDRKYGFIHITASNDGTMETETSRTDYLEGYGEDWNAELEGQQ